MKTMTKKNSHSSEHTSSVEPKKFVISIKIGLHLKLNLKIFMEVILKKAYLFKGLIEIIRVALR